MVGICFGHQLLAYSLGGKVEKMKLENKPLFCGKETIRLNESFYDLPFVKEVVGENLDEE